MMRDQHPITVAGGRNIYFAETALDAYVYLPFLGLAFILLARCETFDQHLRAPQNSKNCVVNNNRNEAWSDIYMSLGGRSMWCSGTCGEKSLSSSSILWHAHEATQRVFCAFSNGFLVWKRGWFPGDRNNSATGVRAGYQPPTHYCVCIDKSWHRGT